MVASGHNGLGRWVERGIYAEAASDPNGVDVYQHFFYGEGRQVAETLQDHWKGRRRSSPKYYLGNPGWCGLPENSIMTDA